MQTIVVKNSGQIQYLVHDTANELLEVLEPSAVDKRRASLIVPTPLLKRLAFNVLRFVFGDCGRVAEYTRTWRCDWTVDLRISGGPIVTGFAERSAAIAYEHRFFIGRVE